MSSATSIVSFRHLLATTFSKTKSFKCDITVFYVRIKHTYFYWFFVNLRPYFRHSNKNPLTLDNGTGSSNMLIHCSTRFRVCSLLLYSIARVQSPKLHQCFLVCVSICVHNLSKQSPSFSLPVNVEFKSLNELSSLF